ncbi:MAG: ABC transporter permease subunit [Planctomycetota bacterium]|nr:MAG: ABC transporter permease subunit [Planctomycetota bacterium]
MFVAGYADGTRRLYHATAEQLVAEMPGDGERVRNVAVAPKDDAVLAVAGDALLLTPVDAPHPGITWKTIFGRVWYEGYNEPDFVWQSSSGTDDFEPKYSLVPLIFGTLKATFYTMLLAVPLALAAAVYSSEFLDRRVKQRVKPAIELMAGLPSVVLGFLAALVFAPIVAKIVPQTLSFLIVLPWFFLLSGYLWQLLPRNWALRFSGVRMWMAIPVGAAAAGVSVYAGKWCEQVFFAGNVMEWLNNRQGSATGGWAYICLPAAGLLTAIVVTRFVNEPLRRATKGASRTTVAGIELGKFLVATAAAFALSWGMGWALTSLGWDPRDSLMGTYVQRNALVVGFAMAFAVIPIIYTIADDALTAVPDHLRAASLGAGATPWQTAVRVVIPTAAGGLFSAVMIGLGRAVGETMIVLMAAGNTPIMEWNIFNGFRTLSANIAVELPEAVQNGTHYRMLFLAALVLFAMTFVINTAAEIVRLRFRKKAVRL